MTDTPNFLTRAVQHVDARPRLQQIPPSVPIARPTAPARQRHAAPAAADAGAREQIRRRPPITLPRLASGEREPVPIPEPAAPKPAIPIATIVEAAAFYGLHPDQVVRNGPSTQPRPLPMNVALYFVRTLSGATYEHAARELGIRSSEVVSAGHRKVAHQRLLDPDLARQLAAIEAVLNAT
jgi:hypothetical protein